MTENNKILLFEWATKSLLRQEKNFDILEGFVQVLLGEPIKIVEILEKEPNSERNNKFVRIDLVAKLSNDDVILVDIQQFRGSLYWPQIMCGATEILSKYDVYFRTKYGGTKKAYSFNILYNDNEQGEDYIYRSESTLTGVGTGDVLQSKTDDKILRKVLPEQFFIEHYIIRTSKFDIFPVETPIDEWVYYLKTGYVNNDTQVPGLQEVRQKLLCMNLDEEERCAYDNFCSKL